MAQKSSNPYLKKSMEELLALQAAITADPESRRPLGADGRRSGIAIYTAKADRKLDMIAWAITNKLPSTAGGD